jgi:sulfatase-modifying factor enzyme 1/TIR domain-containing protein
MARGEHQEKPIGLFYSYSHRDEVLRNELEAHLSFLRRSNLIAEWHDRMIGAGDEWKGQIDRQLAAADIILLLVSADFIASDYCWGEEMTKALARHQLGDARVIPVILRPCRWQRTPLGSLQAVPKDGKPVSEWPNHDVAFDQIAVAVERTIADLQQQRRRAGEQAQQQTQEARKRVEAKARQAIEEQQRDAQWREQDKARRAAEAEAAPSENLLTPVRPVAKLISDLDAFRDVDAPWCPEMVALPLGEFLMGSPEDEEGRSSDEGPQHRVTIGYRFGLGRYPVTVAEYRKFVEASGHRHEGGMYVWTGSDWKPDKTRSWRDPGFAQTDRHPVVGVSWRDAIAYSEWLGRQTGKSCRLPSEAEWEYACRRDDNPLCVFLRQTST